jgi:tryptophan halogenase
MNAPTEFPRVDRVAVLGGGSAGLLAALALKLKLPGLRVTVVRSRDIGIIGVGEGSTIALTRFLHEYIGVGPKKFHELAEPTWKLGLRFVGWGPRPQFFYTFGAAQPAARLSGLSKPVGFYSDVGAEADNPANVYDRLGALMAHDRVFDRTPGGAPALHDSIAYHFENEKFVRFLEDYARSAGVQFLDDTVAEVRQGEQGVAALEMRSGRTESADLYVDCSGFASLLLGRTLGEPFGSFAATLFCDRAVVGGWDRTHEPIKPYTTCETMDGGWCWQIEHENRINRGYVYASAFLSDEQAEAEFRSANPKVGPTRVVRFVSGSYRRAWVKNVVAVGNAAGFVEPLEATALGVIAMQSRLLADTLLDANGAPRPTQQAQYNRFHQRTWEQIRDFLSVHYAFNTARDTPFWRHCRAHTDLAGAAEVVEHYRENGPTALWQPTMLDAYDPFGVGGYSALLLGQKVPFHRTWEPPEAERRLWSEKLRLWDESARRAMTVKEALAVVRSPKWKWLTPHHAA